MLQFHRFSIGTVVRKPIQGEYSYGSRINWYTTDGTFENTWSIHPDDLEEIKEEKMKKEKTFIVLLNEFNGKARAVASRAVQKKFNDLGVKWARGQSIWDKADGIYLIHILNGNMYQRYPTNKKEALDSCKAEYDCTIVQASDFLLKDGLYEAWRKSCEPEKDEFNGFKIDLSWVKGEARGGLSDKIFDVAVSKGYGDTYRDMILGRARECAYMFFEKSGNITKSDGEFQGGTYKELSVNKALKGDYPDYKGDK